VLAFNNSWLFLTLRDVKQALYAIPPPISTQNKAMLAVVSYQCQKLT